MVARGVAERLSLLTSESTSVRNNAALELRDLAESGVEVPVEPFFSAVENPAHRDNRGTLVYALQTMDCSRRFRQLFDLALDHRYEVSMHAYAILAEQPMEVTPQMLHEAEAKLASFTPPSDMAEEDAKLITAELADVLARFRDRCTR